MPTGTTRRGRRASMNETNCSARVRSNLRRNQPWPSASTRAVVIRAGGSANRRRNSGWCVSDLSRKAISAEVSTYARGRDLVLAAIDHVVDAFAGLRVTRLDHPGVAHPGLGG